ncbi:sulfur carrier protein ThiS adenylyltransferase ThiF [Acidobacteriota bacterium]
MKKLEKQLFSEHDPKILPILRRSVVGIAGAGGLGSNIAITLARSGVGKLIIADFDKIEPSNLNRQHYFVDQIGKVKVEALLENLKKVNPYSRYEVQKRRITRRNLPEIFVSADILVEAFDEARMKQLLIETWLSFFPERPIIVASGLAGFGRNEKLHTRKAGNLYICGDEESIIEEGISPMAPRVGIVANMQANLVLELLVKKKIRHE